MASYTGMSNLQNHPHRSGFDIGRKNAFTAKVGELLPVYWDISMPGDKYKFNVEYFTRTQPVETSAYTRLREYFDFYAVPLRLLWKSAPAVLTQMQDVNQIQALSLTQNLALGTYLPSSSLAQLNTFLYFLNGASDSPGAASSSSTLNMFGFNRGDLSYKLLSYLGYGNFITTSPAVNSRWWSTSLKNTDDGAGYTQQYVQNNYVNIFPLLAYQKIYQDFFRWSQWEKSNPSSYNVDYYTGTSLSLFSSIPNSSSDYWKSDTMFDLKYCNWNKDMLMGVLPNSQFGDVAVIDLGDSPSNVLISDSSGNPRPVDIATALSSSANSSPVSVHLPTGETVDKDSSLFVSLKDISSQMTVLALRQAEALQRWKEISQSGDSDYREQIRKHFGVKLPQALSNMCTYIGGISRNLDISEVVNNNLAGEGDTAVIAGKGVGAGNGSFTYTTDEHCVVMCIYHAVPLLDYTITGQDGQLLVTDAESLPIPEFDNIGMEVLPMTQIFNSALATAFNLFNAGYCPRYFNWKTKLDVINGAFTTTLKSWVSPVSESLLSGWARFGGSTPDAETKVALNYKFFKVSPSVLDPIFGVKADSTWDTDQLLVNSYIGCYVARNLSRDGVPY